MFILKLFLTTQPFFGNEPLLLYFFTPSGEGPELDFTLLELKEMRFDVVFLAKSGIAISKEFGKPVSFFTN
jgi:hypothetical protein